MKWKYKCIEMAQQTTSFHQKNGGNLQKERKTIIFLTAVNLRWAITQHFQQQEKQHQETKNDCKKKKKTKQAYL